MIGKLIPLVIALSGLGAGVGAGIALRPAPEPAGEIDHAAAPCGEPVVAASAAADPDHPPAASEFVKMENQFVVPVIEDQAVAAMVVLSLTLEVAPEQSDAVFDRMPKLRDGFLRVLLDHANVGGFDGAFTANGSMGNLRSALTEVGRQELGTTLVDVLILDINRQDV